MNTVGLAASRDSGTGWIQYDEEYRLRKARYPFSSWAQVDTELWVLYVATPDRMDSQVIDKGVSSQSFHHGSFQGGNKGNTGWQTDSLKGFRTCWCFNKGKCQFGINCKFVHKCSNCFGNHPLLCASEQMFQYSQLYSLGISPICITEVENALLYYPFTKIANALIRGLKFGVKLHYSGSHMPFKAKHLKSVFENPDLVRQRINTEVNLGRMAEPFKHPFSNNAHFTYWFGTQKRLGFPHDTQFVTSHK
jgi:hypothetical protein